MNRSIYFLMPILIFSQACSRNKDHNKVPDKVSRFEILAEKFHDPPTEYSTAPLWVWNDAVTRDEIDTQLDAFMQNGIQQVFIHPRPGLITEYLSAEWFDLWKYAMEKAGDLGMNVWIYDENSFPSGFAGGHVPAMMPPGADPVAGLRMHKPGIISDENAGNFMVVLKKVGNSFANITNGVRNYIGVPGSYYGFSKWYYPDNQGLYGGFSYVDLLAYGITEKFNRITMKGYETVAGEEFGKHVPGIFTDEPNINASDDPDVIRFTPVLFRLFKEKYGYPLSNYLPCLFEETGDWKNVRHDYYALLLEMFIDRWAKPWYIYADSNHLNWTGHYWEHAWPNPEYGPDAMAMYAWHQYPGVDMLFNNEKARPDQFGNTRAIRELASVANQLGKERTLSETYGAGGWELTFGDMKRLGDWEFALGVNFMDQHLSYMTLKGARKRDFPQSFSYHTPWWSQYKTLARYYHRLSFALASGDQVNRILVLEPTSTAWMYFSPREGEEHSGVERSMEEFRTSFHSFLDTLEHYQVEYDLGCENIIRDHGRVENGKFVIGNRAYDTVVLPPMLENLENQTYELLRTYLEQKGTVLSFCGFPAILEGNISRKMPGTWHDFRKQWITADKPDKKIISDYLQAPGFIADSPENWHGRVYHQRRKFEDGQLLFIINFDSLESADISLRCAGKAAVELDPFTGEIRAFPAEISDGTAGISCSIRPAGSLLLFMPDRKPAETSPPPESTGKPEPVATSGLEINRDQPNSLTLEYCDLKIGQRVLKDIYFYNAADTVYRTYLHEIYGFNYNPWSVAVQYRTRILDKNEFGEDTGFEATFPFNAAPGYHPDSLKVVFERPGLFTVRVNGNNVSPEKGRWWLDRSFGVAEIASFVQPGRNEVTLTVSPMNVLAELEPVYLTGNFGVNPAREGWILTSPAGLKAGSWKDQGLPFYSQSVNYAKSFTSSDPDSSYIVALGAWKGTVAEVLVNGENAGIIGWQPYTLDISRQVTEGRNLVEVKVYGSLKNLLGPHHNHPVKGLVTPWSFFYAPARQPPGDTYDLLDYGLFEDYRILKK